MRRTAQQPPADRAQDGAPRYGAPARPSHRSPTPAVGPPAATSPLTRQQQRLLDAAVEIRAGAPEDPDYTHSVFTSVYLPIRDPGAAAVWDRSSGRAHLRIEAGSIWSEEAGGYVRAGLPYGARARVVMIYLVSEAVRRASPEIEVGECLTEFVRRLGLRKEGRVNEAVREQLRRLAVATIRLAYAGEGRTQQVNAQIIEGVELWAEPAPGQRPAWCDTVVLSDRFFRAVRQHAVPLDDRAVARVANNPTALDVYAWLAGRLHRVRTPEPVSWAALAAQFSQSDVPVRRFRQAFLETLRKVSLVYDGTRALREEGNGLVLHYAPPPVPKLLRLLDG